MESLWRQLRGGGIKTLSNDKIHSWACTGAYPILEITTVKFFFPNTRNLFFLSFLLGNKPTKQQKISLLLGLSIPLRLNRHLNSGFPEDRGECRRRLGWKTSNVLFACLVVHTVVEDNLVFKPCWDLNQWYQQYKAVLPIRQVAEACASCRLA